MNIRVFPPIRDSAEFVNASGQGLPLHLYRPPHPALGDFKETVKHLATLIGNGVAPTMTKKGKKRNSV
jgi:chromosome partitioning protein